MWTGRNVARSLLDWAGKALVVMTISALMVIAMLCMVTPEPW